MQRPSAGRRNPELPRDCREMFRYTKSGRVRAYSVKDVSEDTSELWVTSELGKVAASRKLAQFANPLDVNPFLQDIERELRLGGWSKCF